MNNKFISWSIFILLCFIWGSSFILMKISSVRLSVSQIAALRIFSAGAVFIPAAVIHITKVPVKKLFPVFLAGIFGNLVPAFLFAAAITRIDSSLAGILNSLTPICVAVIGILFFKDKIGLLKIAGVLIGFTGVCLLTFMQKNISLANLGYASLILLGTISYGINVNTVSHYLKGMKPLHVTSISLSFLAIPTVFILWYNGFFQLDMHDPEIQWAITASVMLGLVGSAIATALFYVLVQKAGGLFASLVTYGIPFVALFWGVLDGEKVTAIEILCLAVILSGVYLANRPEKREKE
jgi:drug/metabolite transporter (DMT)-like permease